MDKKIKLHLGCGTVYLLNDKDSHWINVDVKIPEHFLAEDRPDLVIESATTVDKYYKHDVNKADILSGKLHHQCTVVDAYGSVFDLPFKKSIFDEIRLVQVFEHLTFKEGQEALRYWKYFLKPNGVLHLDIPDLDGTIDIYKTDPEWGTRLLFGSQRNQYGQHKSMYSKTTIAKVLENEGYKNIKFLPNIHFYPAFAVEAQNEKI